MELWRERGFVPDSDEDDDFESQQSNNLSRKTGTVLKPGILVHEECIPEDTNAHGNQGDQVKNGLESQVVPKASESELLEAQPRNNPGEGARKIAESDIHGDEIIAEDLQLQGTLGDQDQVEDHAESQVIPQGFSDTLLGSGDLDDDPLQYYDGPSNLISRTELPSTTTGNTTSSDAIRRFPSSTDRSSSPDELQFEEHFRPRTPVGKDPQLNCPKGDGGNDSEDSSLSPALSNPQTPPSFRDPGPRRALRGRKFINLHPYLVDQVEYQRWCASNNIRPIRVAPADRDSNRRDESQGQEFVNDAAPPASSPVGIFRFPPGSPSTAPKRRKLAQPVRPLRNSPRTINSRKTPIPSSSTKLPPLSTSDVNGSDRKTRNISRPPRGVQGNEPQETRQNQIQVVVDNRVLGSPPQEAGDIFDVPLSSPSSGRKSSNKRLQRPIKFRFPRGYSPSPIVSLVLQEQQSARNQDSITINDSSDIDLEPNSKAGGNLSPQLPLPLSVEEIDRLEETEDFEESEELATIELQRLRRKIKGVLPASWPRLDLKQQQEKERAAAEKARLSYLRNRRQSGKGVAQRISRKRSDGYNQKTNLSSSDDEPSHTAQSSRGIMPELMDADDPFADENADDIIEDNRIDYMLPPAPRKAKRRDLQHRRGLGSHQGNSLRAQDSSMSRKRSQHQARITDTLKRPRIAAAPSKSRLPRLGILDAADVKDQLVRKQPQFLRVAARQARFRRDHGRKSPTRTYLKLGTRQDTEDANKSLREWKAGSLQQSKIVVSNRAKKRLRRSYESSVVEYQNYIEPNQNMSHQVRTDEARPVPRIDDDVTSARSDQQRPALETLPTALEKGANLPNPSRTQGQVTQRWKVRKGGYAISSLRRNAPRPAQLDISVTSSLNLGRASSFQRSLSVLNSLYKTAASPRSRNTGLLLARFLTENPPPQNAHPSPPNDSSNSRGGMVPSHEQSQKRRHQRRKRPPRHLNVENVEDSQPLSVDTDAADAYSIKSVVEVNEHQSLKGLKPASAVYTANFGIFPLPVGTFFHSSTFIGSGDLSGSMKLSSRNLGRDNGRSMIQYADQTYRWGPWNETVSSELGALLDTLLETARKCQGSNENIIHDSAAKIGQTLDTFRSIITYVNDKLYFMDSVDRSMFVDRCIVLLSKVSDTLPFSATNFLSDSTAATRFWIKLEVLTYVFANQIRQIASHELVQTTKYFEIVGMMTTIQNRILHAVLNKTGLTDIRQFLEEVKWRQKRESGIKDDYPFVEAFLVVQKIFYTDPMLRGTNEDLLSQAVLPPSTSHLPNDAHELEKLWHGVFMTLPLYEFDELGIFHPGQRLKETFDQWQTIKRLVSPVFDASAGLSKASAPAFNNYCRALFHRCFYLIDSWGWRHSKVMLDTLFDFFAKNSLHNLIQEQSFGSPSFLDELDRQPTLEMEPRDSYQPLRIEDLEALRNHHDLLCTLYWATPDTCRPRVETIRDLVHPATAHKEACAINIHSWLRLVRFKLSTDEDTAGLVPFADWHASFVINMLQQHSHARTDIENQVASNSLFSRQTVEDAVIDYQKPIESLLSNALVNLKIAIDAARAPDQARVLLERLPISRLLELFNPRIARLHSLICKTLDVVLAYANTNMKTQASTGPTETSDDSQEFEGWAVLAELCVQEERAAGTNLPVEHLNNVVRPVIYRFLSTCYGEDQAPDDIVLLKIVDCWSSVANTLVSHRLKEWSSYINQYSEDSWASLRATDQTRKFLPYFLASLIEKDGTFYKENQHQILNHWIECIVERGSMLKYQHVLTKSIMNADGSNALLKNLPFSKNPSKYTYEITLQEFSQRRLSLISCILSNMREYLSDAEDLGTHDVQITRSRYRGLIETLMSAMKAKYSELGSIDSSAHSSYLDFVHQVVSFLQQHSQRICPIDPFFTNPSTFPLPAGDPNYIVGKLKGYAVRLTSGKVANELFTFLQHVSERAAIDGQQTHLVDQLYSVMAEPDEPGERHQSTIRLFLLHCILPAYVEICLIAPGAWILVRPLLQSLTRILMGSILFINTCDDNSISVFVEAMAYYFESVDNALRLLVDHPGLLDEPHILLTVTSLLETIITSLPTIDYLDRISSQTSTLVAYVDIFKQFALFAASTLLDPAAAVAPRVLDLALAGNAEKNNGPPLPQFFADARNFAARGLKSRFQDGWSFHNGKYFVRPEHSQQVKEVAITEPACTSMDTAKQVFIKTVELYFGTMDRLVTFSPSSF
ncbi:hypothetical protein ACJ72_01424 [Emergomyces africanus]|uniref:Mus7/MMS22 family-domain-containing protein n=1 Tax=Emergomyces africanus TaxID=1955775 RepID=A0A1B7P5A6_9EURO|nr:hypothetical protein ACJ72_01424 [Emergomyces africanus]